MRVQNSSEISFGKLYVSTSETYTKAQNQTKNYIANALECTDIEGNTYTDEVKKLGYDIMLSPDFLSPEKIGISVSKYYQDSKLLYGSYNRVFDMYMGSYGAGDFDSKDFVDSVKRYDNRKNIIKEALKIIGAIGLGALLLHGVKTAVNKERIRNLEKAICVKDSAIISNCDNSKTLRLFA